MNVYRSFDFKFSSIFPSNCSAQELVCAEMQELSAIPTVRHPMIQDTPETDRDRISSSKLSSIQRSEKCLGPA